MSQNNFPSWITLALVIIVGCVVTGMMLGFAGPFDREANMAIVHITETQAAIIARATQSYFDLIQAQQSITMIQFHQTATVMNVQNGQWMAQATLTANSNNYYVQDPAGNAPTTIVRSQVGVQTPGASIYIASIIGLLTICKWIWRLIMK
jgi:hypothetical protein